MKLINLVTFFVAPFIYGQQLQDLGSLFSKQQNTYLLKIVNSLQNQSNIDITILTQKSADAAYQEKLQSWQSRSATSPNKVIFTILSESRKIKIENSMELSSQFTPEYKKELITQYMIPSFKLRDYSTGVIQSLVDIGDKFKADLYEVVPNQFAPPLRLKKNIIQNDWILPFLLGAFILYLLWIKFLGYTPNTRFIFGALFFGITAYLTLGRLPIQIIFLTLLGGYLFWSGFSHIIPDPVNVHETTKKPILIICLIVLSLALSYGIYYYTKLSSISVLLGFIFFGFITNKNRVYFSNKVDQSPFPQVPKKNQSLNHLGGSAGKW